MMNLDDRARSAAAGLRSTVDSADLRLADRAPGSRPPVGRALLAGSWWAFAAGAAVAGVVLVGTLIETSPDTAAPDDVVTTTVASTTTSAPSVTTPMPATSVTTSARPPETTGTTLDTLAPKIEVTSPEDGFVSEVASITFAGTTEPGAVVTAGQYEATVEPDGSWHIVLVLAEGENRARFVATDSAGNRSEAWVTVVLKTPEVTTTTKVSETTTTEAPGIEFTAFATFGECSETPPFDVYHGTDQPGAVVEISSPYGSGRVEVGESGTWEMRVEFPESPVGKTIEVVVEDNLGHRKVLPFTRL
jgi:hypothetical protein